MAVRSAGRRSPAGDQLEAVSRLVPRPKATIGRPELRVHDLRHTAASAWLGAGADPKVVQRVLGHASAAMTMDLYGHLIDRNLWDAADRFGGTTGASSDEGPEDERGTLRESGA